MDGIDAQLARYHAMNNRVTEASRGTERRGDDKLREVSLEFEALFVEQMLDSMRKTVHKENDILDGGMAQDIFEDMLYQEYARIMSKTGSLGLADLVYQELAGDSSGGSPTAED
jgi:flagellar protein FlgJ